ncbi:unnamed protein product, partial [marine sediment metagenome]
VTCAILGEWALNEIGVPSRRMNIKTPDGWHQVCLSNDNSVFITVTSGGSADVVEIEGHWGKFLYNYFRR